MIKTVDFGKHSGVLYAEFGTGDIRFTKGRETNEEHGSLLMFRNNDVPRKIGEVDNEEIGIV